MDIDVFNIRKICRGCLSDNKENLRSIFDSNILNTFMLCTNIQVSEEDGLPKLICSSCVYKVVSWFTFKTQCKQSDQILKDTFQCAKHERNFTNEHSVPEIEVENIDPINDNVVDENVVIIYRTNECKPIFQPSHKTDTEDKSDNWNGTKSLLKAEEHSENYINKESSKDNVHQDNDYEGVFERDEKDIIYEGYFESDENDSKNLNNLQPIKTKNNPLKIDKLPPKTEIPSTTSQRKQVNCEECGINCRNADRLSSHQRSVHEGKKPEICPICEKEFNNLRALRRHRLKHSDVKQYRCDQCGKMYKYQTSLTLHKKGHANLRRYVCDLCGKSFVRAHGLQSHLLSHSTITPFSCDYNSCGKQFKNIIMLRNHQRRHEGIKKFSCSECGKEFITSAELNTHIRSHTGLKPFGCSMCDKSYKTRSHLSVHYRSHSGVRPYACDICPLKFAHNKVLKHHRLVHSGELPWSCDECGRPFRQKSTLMKHKKLHLLNGKSQKWEAETANSTKVEKLKK